ncbi:MAG: excisionase family DNA-binding protein [Deltaproteobacteria bacterium]|jgi:excisionase family DNA binding protein|nr:excisionase family DNA-binding protein [Deltaproteobacteria bacterium]
MANKQILTTFEAAALCNVSYNTIKNWIKRGLLSAYRTAGGHLRINIDDLESFSREYALPINDKHDPEKKKIVVVDKDGEVSRSLQESFHTHRNNVEVRNTDDIFEAGILIESMKPDLVILNTSLTGLDATKACKSIHMAPSLKNVKVAVVSGPTAPNNGADLRISTPFDHSRLFETVKPVIMPKGGVRGRRKKTTPAV